MPDFIKQPERAPLPERPLTPDVSVIPEKTETKIETTREPKERAEVPRTAPPVAPDHVIPASARVEHPQSKSEELRAIEKVMASGLEEIYRNLDPKTQRVIKDEGEQTASKIEALLQTGKDVAKKILHLIRAWLHKIPGVNVFFLEQESKIKTDKIMAMSRKE